MEVSLVPIAACDAARVPALRAARVLALRAARSPQDPSTTTPPAHLAQLIPRHIPTEHRHITNT